MCDSCKFKPVSCSYHSHSDRSLDGVCTPKAMVKRTKELGRPGLSCTDHGTMGALFTLWQECAKEKLAFAPGQEIYLLDPWSQPKVGKNGEVTPGYSHCTVHYLDVWAYEYFCRLSLSAARRAVMAGGELKPLITWEELQGASGHITVGSCCLGGVVQKQVVAGNLEAAEAAYLALRDIAGPGKFFVEVFGFQLTQTWVYPKYEGKSIAIPGYFKDNDIDECSGGPLDVQKAPNMFVLAMARKYGDPVICSEDSHLGTDDDKDIQDLRLGNNWRFSCSYSMKTSEDLFHGLQDQLGNDWSVKDHEQAIDNSYMFIDLFKGFTMRTPKTDGWMLPTVQTVYGDDCTSTSKELLLAIIKRVGRLPTDERRPAYIERLKYELDVFTNYGIDAIPYLLCVADIVENQRQHGNLVSLRGSAGGALLYWLCSISTTDPIKHGLSFDRHLTPANVKTSLPDADMDMPYKDKAIEYARKKYGDRCVLISTIQMMRMKSAIKDLERKKYGKVRFDTDRMCAALPSPPQGTTDQKFIHGYTDGDGNPVPGLLDEKGPEIDALKKYIADNPDIWEKTEKCMGVASGRGVHAAGVVIAPVSVHHWLPVVSSKDREIVTDYTMKEVEAARGVKFDFLGLKALEIVSHAMDFVKESTGVVLEWGEFPHDDRVYTMIIQKNLVAGIFQLCSEKALRPWVVKFPVKCIRDISNLVALIRPGALDAPAPDGSDTTAAEYFVEVENKRKKPHYIHPSIEPILGATNSIILYQEQISEIFVKIGDLSPTEAVAAMKAVSKKDKEKLEKYCGMLKAGALSRGWEEEKISLLIETIMASAKYCFNKSHSTAYAVLPYNQCWLKYFYPKQWWAGYMTGNADNEPKIREVLPECRHLILQPDLLTSHATRWKIVGEKILAPLMLYSGIGPTTAEAVVNWVAERKPTSLEDMCAKMQADKKEKILLVDAGTMLVLLFGGAMDAWVDHTSISDLKAAGEKIKKAFASKATGGTKTKGIAPALKDISSLSQLYIWRYEYNPVFSFPLSVMYTKQLELDYGYVACSHWSRTHSSFEGDIWACCDTVFEEGLESLYGDREYCKKMMVVGVVVDRESRPLKDGKPSYVVSLFTGYGVIALRLWCKWKTNEIDEDDFNRLSKGNTVLCEVKPNLWQGRRGGSIGRVVQLG